MGEEPQKEFSRDECLKEDQPHQLTEAEIRKLEEDVAKVRAEMGSLEL